MVNEFVVDQALFSNFMVLIKIGHCSTREQWITSFVPNYHKAYCCPRTQCKCYSVMISSYAGIPCKYTSPLQGLEKFVSNVSYEPGCSDVACSNNNQLKATTEVTTVVDAVIVVVGLNQSFEAEMVGWLNLTLSGYQELLVFEVAKAAKGPLVLVVLSGGWRDLVSGLSWISWRRRHCQSGRCPFSWYPQSFVDQVPKTDINLRQDSTRNYPDRTFQVYLGKLMYDFGHGLSYSGFSKFIMSAPSTVLVRHRDNTNVIV
ncbi:hypothetical protein HYC85_004125 [Camellia sinensis]|uniref:Glycoside hydrolase family 3 C-terminal domain-containing protein n=1 Tax=Camellia sinensis TaxID=4442 RepID=A0A7J7HVL9_CAMSI|nr:hypothetical protein HYC85_004125 [Camellia sinensis]